MIAELLITSLQVVDGYMDPGHQYPNQYNGSKSVISRSYVAKCYEVIGTILGREVRFKSPTVIFNKTVGMLNYMHCEKENNWFTVVDGEQTAHRGHPMFDGGKYPNVSIDDHSQIVQLIKVGDKISITYAMKHRNPNLSFDTIWRVKINK